MFCLNVHALAVPRRQKTMAIPVEVTACMGTHQQILV